jgi:Flp pilus assembly protein TadG
MENQPVANVNQAQRVELKNPLLYFVPPITGTYMEWGQTLIIFLFIAAMFIFIAFIYIYVKIDDYQNRISVIANATVFGQNPQDRFKQFIQSTQAEALAAAMNNIQTAAEDVNSNAYRLDDKTQRLGTQVSRNVTNGTGKTLTDLGKTISDTIGGVLDNVQTSLAKFTLNNSMQDGAVKTTQKK